MSHVDDQLSAYMEESRQLRAMLETSNVRVLKLQQQCLNVRDTVYAMIRTKTQNDHDAFDAAVALCNTPDLIKLPPVVNEWRRLAERCCDAEMFLEHEGYRFCDIAACNCGSWHHVGQSVAQRTKQIERAMKILNDAVVEAQEVLK